jgi:hypothetical protein
MQSFISIVKWFFLFAVISLALLFLANPAYQLAQSAYTAYQEKVAEQKRLEEQKQWLTASQIKYPISKEQFQKLDIIQISKRLEREDIYSHKFIFEHTKVQMESGAFRKFHPDVWYFYETCQKTIDSDRWLTEFYTAMVADEILGLNSEMTRVSGLVDSYSEIVGRDYVYYMADNQIKFLMEELNERGAKILVENLRASEQKRQKFELYTPSSSDFTIGKNTTKTMGEFVIVGYCLQADVKLGLLGMGTNFQIRAQQASDMLRKKLKVENAENRDKRRQELTETLNRLNNLN